MTCPTLAVNIKRSCLYSGEMVIPLAVSLAGRQGTSALSFSPFISELLHKVLH